ncbi:ATP-binding protein [Candidatus Dependentiae bacterium]|nr:ATP-binding protein [Candidatus Dependentiae bacterium]
MKFFNTAGPVNSEKHYFIPHRLNEGEIKQLIAQEKYFILHAPRQSGKTTAILELVKQLNIEGKYKALYINIEAAQAARGKTLDGLRTILDKFETGIQAYFGEHDPAVPYLLKEIREPQLSGNSLQRFLQFWAQHSEKPLVIFIDEIDSLVGDTLISVLRQLRDGYANRPHLFPQSVCLFGVRDVRDYMIWSEQEQKTILGGSAFNIKAESLSLPVFSCAQVHDLYQQHTAETSQQFTNEAIEYAFHLTQGQPWLVNALAYQACFRDVTDRSQTITKDVIEQAKEALIKRRDTHIDVLVTRLEEPRVRRIIDAILSGGEAQHFSSDDISYVEDLGLKKKGSFEIANPIYQDVIPRELIWVQQEAITLDRAWYIRTDGLLDMPKFLEHFAQFFREGSDNWLKNFDYQESGPHLLIMAYLQRVINGPGFASSYAGLDAQNGDAVRHSPTGDVGGGSINREYALGRKRVDLLINWKTQRIVIELKINRANALTEGLRQTAEYMDRSAATEGHLVIFDRDPTKSWDEKIYTKQETIADKLITVWGM